jgi:uncharacterized small protein (DUF1192 family)
MSTQELKTIRERIEQARAILKHEMERIQAQCEDKNRKRNVLADKAA